MSVIGRRALSNQSRFNMPLDELTTVHHGYKAHLEILVHDPQQAYHRYIVSAYLLSKIK